MKTTFAHPALIVLLVSLAAVTRAQDDAPRVSVGTAEQAPNREEVPLTGTLSSPQVAEVSTSVGGLVERVGVDVGDRVEVGSVLLDLDRELEQHTLEAARAATAQARAELAEVGEWVEPGTVVVELIATDGLRLDFRVPQRYFPRIGADIRLQVSLDAVPGRRLAARIGTVVPVNDPAARTFLLRTYLI